MYISSGVHVCSPLLHCSLSLVQWHGLLYWSPYAAISAGGAEGEKVWRLCSQDSKSLAEIQVRTILFPTQAERLVFYIWTQEKTVFIRTGWKFHFLWCTCYVLWRPSLLCFKPNDMNKVLPIFSEVLHFSQTIQLQLENEEKFISWSEVPSKHYFLYMHVVGYMPDGKLY